MITDDKRIIIDGIVESILSGKVESGKCYIGSLRRVATWAMPFVDYAFQDSETKKTVAVVFFDDVLDCEKAREYAVKALNTFDAVVVAFGVRYLSEADYYIRMLSANRLLSLPIGVLAYDNKGGVSIMRKLTVPHNQALSRTRTEQKSYWCWWRDGSHYEVATLLELSRKYDFEDGDIYTDKVYPEFFNLMIDGKTKKWDGSPRVKQYSAASYKAEKQNYKIPMCQLGLWDVDTGHITDKGLTLLDVVYSYGADSKEYFDCLAKIILIDGKHLDLIKDLDEFQKNNKEIIPESSSDFFVLFDDYMIRKNSIGTRKPTAIKTGAKKAYVRDEPKLWNKLGLIKMQSAVRYYKPFLGIEFNWDRINEILLSDVFGGSDE